MPTRHCGTCNCVELLPEHGMRFKSSSGAVYILAMVDYKRFALIGLESGNRWSEPATLSRVRAQIKGGEFSRVTV